MISFEKHDKDTYNIFVGHYGIGKIKRVSNKVFNFWLIEPYDHLVDPVKKALHEIEMCSSLNNAKWITRIELRKVISELLFEKGTDK